MNTNSRADTSWSVWEDRKNKLKEIQGLQDWERDLVWEVLTSHALARSDIYPDLLLYLLSKSQPEDRRTERYEGRIASALYSVNTNPKIRSMLSHLRAALGHYYLTQGKGHRYQIKVERGSKLVSIVDSGTVYLQRFWAEHEQPRPKDFLGPTTALIVYNAPKFYRHLKDDYFLRYRDINEKTHQDYIHERAPQLLDDKTYSVSRNWIAAGDALCMLGVTAALESLGVRTDHKPIHSFPEGKWQNMEADSIVLIGNTRTHWAVEHAQRQAKLNFRIMDWHIHNKKRSRHTGEVANYRDEIGPKFIGRPRTAFGLVSRFTHPETQKSITAILANEGPTFQLLGQLLSKGNRLKGVFDNLGWKDDEPLPSRFEILFKVLIDREDEPLPGPEYVTHRPKSDLSAELSKSDEKE